MVATPVPFVIPETPCIKPTGGIGDITPLAALNTLRVEGYPLGEIIKRFLKRHGGMVRIASHHNARGFSNSLLCIELVALPWIDAIEPFDLRFGWF